jgi:hypothetical protein
MTIVREGQLLDDRSALARHAPAGALRKPTPAERQAAASPAKVAEQPPAAPTQVTDPGEPPAPITAGSAGQASGDQPHA